MSQLATQGYQVIRAVFSADDIQAMHLAITETIDRVARALRAPFSTSEPEAAFEDRLDRIAAHDRVYALALLRAVLADAQRDPRIDAVARHPQLTSVVSSLIAPLIRTGEVIRTRAVVRAFSSERHRWHQDVVRPSHEGAACGSIRLACWMPLNDVDKYTGSLEIIPGKRESLPHESVDGSFFIQDENLPADDPQAVTLNVGDVLIVDRFTPHRSLPLKDARSRWAVVMWVKAV